MNKNSKPAAPEGGAAQALVTDFASLETELTRQKDLYLHLAADFDNFRKRTAQDSERRAAAQKEAFIRELLPVIDNLERAVTNHQSTREELRQGVQMTLQQLHQILRHHGIEAEDSVGQSFDPHRHEAVGVRHDPSQPDNVILETPQRGYRRDNAVFRPAKVIVNDLSHAEGTSHAG